MNEINESNNQSQNEIHENLEISVAVKPPNGNRKMAIASMISGIISVVFILGITNIISGEFTGIAYCSIIFICAVLGMTFGILSLVKKRQGIGMAIAGIITSAMTLPIGAALMFLLTAMLYID